MTGIAFGSGTVYPSGASGFTQDLLLLGL